MTRYFFYSFLFVFQCSFFLCLSSENLVEEGWRFHPTLSINLKFNERDFELDISHEHYAMAHLLRPPPKSLSIIEKKDKDDKVCCLMRFTPIIVSEGSELKCGKTISLTQEIFDLNAQCDQVKGKVPYSEIGFLSGYYKPDKSRDTESFKIEDDCMPDYIGLIPESRRDKYISNTFSVKLAQRIYMNPKRLEQSINFRYPDNHTPSCFIGGNYDRLLEVNRETKENIKELKKFNEEMMKCVESYISNGKLKSASDYVEVESKKEIFANFSVNSKMLHYVCAEQVALDFLTSIKVQNYLKWQIDLEKGVWGIIINFHCSHSPCCSCATALAAEIQEGGIFQKIFETKVFLICSAQNWYTRAKGMIKHEETKFFGNEEGLNFTPYHMVLLTYDVNQKMFKVNLERYNSMLSSANEKKEENTSDSEDIVGSSHMLFNESNEGEQDIPDLERIIRGKYYNDSQGIISCENPDWVPVRFNRFNGLDDLTPTLDVGDIIIPEDGAYSISVHYCWHNPQAGTHTRIAINDEPFEHGFHTMYHPPSLENTGILDRVTRLSRGDRVSVLIKGCFNADIDQDQFRLAIEKLHE